MASNVTGVCWSVISGSDLDFCHRETLETVALLHPIGSATGYVTMIVYPVLLILSTVGNLFCLHLFYTQKRRTSQVVLLMVLCAANVIVVWLDLPAYLGLNYTKFRNSTSFLNFIDGLMGLVIWIQQAFALISNGSLIFFTVERILVLIKPAKFEKKIRARHTLIISACVAFLAILVSLPNIIYYEYWVYYTQNPVKCNITMSMMCDWLSPWTRSRRSLEISIIDYAIPITVFILLLLLNVVFMIVLMRVRKSKNVLSQPEESRRKELSVTSQMLIRTVILYFATHTPSIVFFTLVILSNYPACLNHFSMELLAVWAPIIRIIFLVNYSVNFFLYIGMAKNYRKWKNLPSRTDVYQLVPMTESGKGLFVTPKKVVIEAVLEPIKKSTSFYIPRKVGHILNDQQFQELWMFLPFRRRIYQPKLIFSTSEDGTSIANFLSHMEDVSCSIIVIKTMKNEVFGAFCGSSWDERVHGKREYLFFGTGETFLFEFNPKIKLYPWVGLCGRKTSPESNLFMAADSRTLIIGGGAGDAISFDSSLARGFSSSCLTFNNPPLCRNGEFETALLEAYTFSDEMV